MPCFDLGMDVYDETFTSPTYNTTYTVEAPEGKKFVSASWKLCATYSSADHCDGDPSTASAIITHKPNDDLTEWYFWFVPFGGGSPPSKLQVRMVTIDS